MPPSDRSAGDEDEQQDQDYQEDQDEESDEDEQEAANGQKKDRATNLQGRVVWMRSAATQYIAIPAAQCTQLTQFIDAVNNQLPALLAVTTLLNSPLLFRFIILLQETGGKKRSHIRYTTVTIEEHHQYKNWYDLNIVIGKVNRLKFEIHVFPEVVAAGYEADLRKAGNGGEIAAWIRGDYRRISRYIPGVDGEVRGGMLPLKDIDTGAIEKCLTTEDYAEWSATMNWFPRRPKNVTEKNKNKKEEGRAGKKLRKQLRVVSDDDEP